MNVAYVTVQVNNDSRARPEPGTPDTDEHLLRSLFDTSSVPSDPIEREQRTSGPIDGVLARERRIVVRGEPGSGKTTLMQWIATTAAANRFSGVLRLWNNTVPFFIRLRHVVEAGFPAPETYISLVAKHISGSRPYDGWEHAQLENGRAVMLIDGVDELPIGKRNGFLEQLKDLVRDYPNARYIITSRPAAVSTANWPEWHEWTQEAGFAEVSVQQMDSAATNEFIDHWHRAYAEGINDPIEGAIDDAWSHFEYNEYAKRLLMHRSRIRLDDPAMLSALIHLPRLQQLHLFGTQVNDLAPLTQLPQLRELSLSSIQVSDLSPLAQLPT